MISMYWNDKNLIKVLKRCGIAVMPTDTLYGIVGRAFEPSAVERIYKIRKRMAGKPFIILIGGISELEKFSITVSSEQKNAIENFNLSTSFVLNCLSDKLSYLHRGTNSLAFRVPAPQELRNLLLNVGPLVAPSANPEGLSPAKNILEAKKYFGDLVDLYVEGGELTGKASKIVKLDKNGSIAALRD
jgi:L-threonylcarbamoyladenylate synthase